MEIYDFKIPYLISRYRQGSITEQEKDELYAWLARDPENVKIFNHIANTSAREKYAALSSVDQQKAWGELDKQIKRKRSGVKRWLLTSSVAAVFILGVVFGVTRGRLMPSPAISIEHIEAGRVKAILTLADGTDIIIDDVDTPPVEQGSSVVSISNGEVKYSDTDSLAANVYNAITVPRGGEHKVTLSDGTQIWLNSDSYVKYPLLFSGGERRIYMRGEAYFDVEPDPDRPFIVETGQQTLQVLGTEFNICAYDDISQTLTTLVEGSVRVESKLSGVSAVLNPGEQSHFDAGDQYLAIRKVDVSDFTAWRHGLINIQNNTLEQVLVKLSRWYDVDFVMAGGNELNNIVFEGDIPKNSSLSTVIKMLEAASEITFIAKPEYIEVRKKLK